MKETIQIQMLLLKCVLSLIVFHFGFILNGQDINAFYIGHSLSDQIPDMVKSLATDHPDVSFDWRYQSIPGAPLRWQWERKDAQDYEPSPPHVFSFYHAEQGLPSAQLDQDVFQFRCSRRIVCLQLPHHHAGHRRHQQAAGNGRGGLLPPVFQLLAVALEQFEETLDPPPPVVAERQVSRIRPIDRCIGQQFPFGQ